jgi:hypothetical protein
MMTLLARTSNNITVIAETTDNKRSAYIERPTPPSKRRTHFETEVKRSV